MAWANFEGPAARGPGHIAPAPVAVKATTPGDNAIVEAQLSPSRRRYVAAGNTGRTLGFDMTAIALNIHASPNRGEAITTAFIELAQQGASREVFRQTLGLLFAMDDAQA